MTRGNSKGNSNGGNSTGPGGISPEGIVIKPGNRLSVHIPTPCGARPGSLLEPITSFSNLPPNTARRTSDPTRSAFGDSVAV
jgi:hypothetical protein